MEVLTNAKAEVNKASNDGTPPLCAASQLGHKEIVKILLKARADPLLSRTNGWNAFVIAASKGHLEILKDIYDHLSRVLQMPPRDIQRFVNAKEKNYGLTALHCVCYEGHLEVVQYLIFEVKADKTIRDLQKKTPLDYARENGHKDIVGWLEAL